MRWLANVSAVKHPRSELLFAGRRVSWDETTEVLRLNAVRDRTLPQQRSSAWSLLVSQIIFFWGGANGAAFEHVSTPSLPLVTLTI